MRIRRFALPISAVFLRRRSFVLFLTVGVNYGIDFKGGTRHRDASAHQATADLGDIRAKVDGLGLGDVQIQGVRRCGERAHPGCRSARRRGRAERGRDQGPRTSSAPRTMTSRRSRWSARASPANSPGPARSRSCFTIAGIMVYIWFRFEWQFAHRLRRDAGSRCHPDDRFLRRSPRSTSTCRASRRS